MIVKETDGTIKNTEFKVAEDENLRCIKIFEDYNLCQNKC